LAKFSEGNEMLLTILIVVLLLMLVGALPRWNHSRRWGYFPSSGLGLVLVIVIVLLLVGRL
jgi:Protein of unknown function (DUF3309)